MPSCSKNEKGAENGSLEKDLIGVTDQYGPRRSSASFRKTFFLAAIAFLFRFSLGFS
jgi:hypothetical protein